MSLCLGIDIGTTGCRIAIVDENGDPISSIARPMAKPRRIDGRPAQDPLIWWNAVRECLFDQRDALESFGRSMGEVSAVAVDGTSGTLLLADSNLNPTTLGYMYNSSGFSDAAAHIERAAPEGSIALGNSSSLARLLFLTAHDNSGKVRHALHQADWITALLLGKGGTSDENNVLKLGYDLLKNAWPSWFSDLNLDLNLMPKVVPAGTPIGIVSDQVAHAFGFSGQTRVVAGTTDSVAAFVASGARQVGEGVTSLGTTLAIKLLSDRPVNNLAQGIYSHRIFGMWLAGGASNSGGGVLEQHFSRDQMAELESRIEPENETGLNYYPLACPGERFPVSDPAKPPKLEPRPEDEAVFFQGILEGIAQIEKAGYNALVELGAPKVSVIFTTGGGSKNRKWEDIRRRMIGCKIVQSSADAAIGSALIAKAGIANGPSG